MVADSILGNIPEDWAVSTLGEICARGGGSVQTGPFGSQLHASDYVRDGVPVVMPANIGDNRIDAAGIARIRSTDAQRLSRHMLEEGDIIYSRRGDVERRALVRTAEEGWVCGTGCLRVRLGKGVVVPAFAAFYLGHPSVREWIVRHAVGATMLNLNTGILEALPFTLPPFRDQARIATFLGALDDKVELNRRINQTLEAMARAIFKSWFVDFNAVGSASVGWRNSTIGNEVTVLGGSTPSTTEASYWGGEFHFLTPRDMSRLVDPIILETERTITSEGLSQISSGLLEPGTVLLSSRAPIGYLAIAEIPVAVNQGFIGMVCDRDLPNYYVLQWARHNMDTIISNANGTTFLEISKKNFRPIEVLVPPGEILDRFVGLVRPLYERITSNLRESKALATIRDALLPKLLSGEIRIKQAEKIVGEVA